MKKFTKILSVALAGTMVLSMAACSASKKTSNRSDSQAAANAEMKEELSGEYYTQETVAADAEYEAKNTSGTSSMNSYIGNGSGTPNRANTTVDQQVPADTMLIRRVSINAETTDYNNVTNAIETKVAEVGGYIESSNENGTGKNGSLHRISYVIRVPIDKLDELVNTVGSSVTVLSSNENTEDVTLQYSDIQSRIESLRVEQQTLNNLLAQADSLDAIITLQNRLTEVRYEIESYESRARVLKNQSSYSTLTLNINEVIEETVQVETKKKTFGDEIWEGFIDTLDNLKDGGRNFVIGLVSALPYIVIIALFALIVFLIVKGIVRKAVKKSKAKTETAAVEESKAADTAKESAEEAADSTKDSATTK